MKDFFVEIQQFYDLEVKAELLLKTTVNFYQTAQRDN